MKKIMFVLALLVLAVPVWAVTTVEITVASVDPMTPDVAIGYITTDGDVRAFALDVYVVAPVNQPVSPMILDVNCVSADYYIYPGSIQINDQGEVTNEGDCACDDAQYPIDTLPGPPWPANSVTIEMGSLYDDDDPFHQTPPLGSGTLVILTLDGDACIIVKENVLRGGIVLEDPAATATLDLPDGSDCFECYAGQADYAEWDKVGKPECWCYPRQDVGDADGAPSGKENFWVSIPDLTIMKSAWQKTAAQLTGNEACADFDHLPSGKELFRVSIPDLTILKANWQILNGPAATSLPGNREP